MRFRHRRAITEPQAVTAHKEAFSLTCLEEGKSGVIVYAHGGYGLVRRLAEMGLTPGVEVKLIRKCPFRGPLEIEVRGTALALGYGVASKVFVKPSRTEANG
ncbi:MAG: FeoA family protein [Candidatus Bathyarchaeota archaeon]|jgi:Fe2+ transport system protein FeoA|nr:ferrous iron transport protein A [Candidatus Bathyarchaeota archaeon A05DMB-5]MDH7558349.1 FeoA family protein [Candidatus Bathyarchaeota archaeon]